MSKATSLTPKLSRKPEAQMGPGAPGSCIYTSRNLAPLLSPEWAVEASRCCIISNGAVQRGPLRVLRKTLYTKGTVLLKRYSKKNKSLSSAASEAHHIREEFP